MDCLLFFDSFFFKYCFYLFIYFLAEQWPKIFWFCLSNIAVTLQAGFGGLVGGRVVFFVI